MLHNRHSLLCLLVLRNLHLHLHLHLCVRHPPRPPPPALLPESPDTPAAPAHCITRQSTKAARQLLPTPSAARQQLPTPSAARQQLSSPVPAQGCQDFGTSAPRNDRRRPFALEAPSDLWDRNPATWTTGAKVPLDAAISTMADKHLGKALAHHKVVLQLPQDWWFNPTTQKPRACTVMCTEAKTIRGATYLNCQVIKPTSCRHEGQVLQFPVSGLNGVHTYHVRRLLNLRHNSPSTLADIGIETIPGVSAITAVIAAWTHLEAVSAELKTPVQPNSPLYALEGPFESRQDNLLWVQRVQAEMDTSILAQVDILEPDPKSHKEAMKHPRLAPFWAAAAIKEMSGLEDRGCFRKHHIKDLTAEQKKAHLLKPLSPQDQTEHSYRAGEELQDPPGGDGQPHGEGGGLHRRFRSSSKGDSGEDPPVHCSSRRLRDPLL